MSDESQPSIEQLGAALAKHYGGRVTYHAHTGRFEILIPQSDAPPDRVWVDLDMALNASPPLVAPGTIQEFMAALFPGPGLPEAREPAAGPLFPDPDRWYQPHLFKDGSAAFCDEPNDEPRQWSPNDLADFIASQQPPADAKYVQTLPMVRRLDKQVRELQEELRDARTEIAGRQAQPRTRTGRVDWGLVAGWAYIVFHALSAVALSAAAVYVIYHAILNT